MHYKGRKSHTGVWLDTPFCPTITQLVIMTDKSPTLDRVINCIIYRGNLEEGFSPRRQQTDAAGDQAFFPSGSCGGIRGGKKGFVTGDSQAGNMEWLWMFGT